MEHGTEAYILPFQEILEDLPACDMPIIIISQQLFILLDGCSSILEGGVIIKFPEEPLCLFMQLWIQATTLSADGICLEIDNISQGPGLGQCQTHDVKTERVADRDDTFLNLLVSGYSIS